MQLHQKKGSSKKTMGNTAVAKISSGFLTPNWEYQKKNGDVFRDDQKENGDTSTLENKWDLFLED